MSTKSSIPLYHRVAAVLRQRVATGSYPVGTRFASEDELAAEFSVSRATIRQALAQLVDDGFITRHHGRGTFVRIPPKALVSHSVHGDLDDLVAAGEVRGDEVRVLGIHRGVTLPPPVAEALELPRPKGTIVERTRTIDDVVFAFTINYLPEDHGRLLSKASLGRSGVLQLLEAGGIRLGEATQTIRAEAADPVVCSALEVPLSFALLSIGRLTLNTEGRPVELVRSWYRSDCYEYAVNYTRRRSSSASKASPY